MTLTVRQTALVALMFVLLSLGLIMLDGRHKLDSLKGVASTVVSPISQALTGLGDGVFSNDGGGDPQLRKDLAAVTAERDALIQENAQLKEQVQEMDQLRAQLGFQQQHADLTLLNADVIGRDPQGAEKYLIIDRGSDDGIDVGMAVVNPNFLVGQVVNVEPHRAKVLLVIDSGFSIGARLQDSREEGIVYGRWQLGGRALMRHLSVDAQIGDDELVVTSNKTAHVPEGLVIGKALTVRRDELENETEIDVLPLVDFDSLETVTVIVGGPGVDQ
jgi:rod shape-determining protein MreC